MDQTGYTILAIALIVVLAVVAIVSFVLYKKTPAPKGCENLEPDEGLCCACLKSGCPFYSRYHDPKTDESSTSSAKPAAPSAGPTSPKAEDKGEKK
jgi:hypothetical protein